ncbi:tripartite tricarboxylate transporter substrate binding protein [Roseomonas sp. SSH11]|uniref:Tripartite tricarboxylate transporter substrate binding protein n=1 Tax=Pararoseomonas baculiformis TaxID=2820812 RepID=A0ABS4AL94_9PROT|nr:tripartite tricarboxylate transporter substrate-binding protein [Pararoseomonas baculiformis]MBP0447781.1 tripartite tricarboxylate transporter substrate binding protein [Pararoseomonas baculiformis]
MSSSRPHLLHTLALGLALSAGLVGHADAQAFPDRPLRLIVPFGPGGGTDLLARVVAERAGQVLGQNIVVENRAGGGATVGIVALTQARPDGYTLAICPPICATAPALYRPAPFDPNTALAPVIAVADLPLVLVVPRSLGVSDVQGLLRKARETRRGLSYASPGAGSSNHLAAEIFRRFSGQEMVNIPYRSGAAALTDVISGRVDFFFDTVASALAQVRSGEVVALGVTGRERAPQLPDVPTMGEAGVPGLESSARARLVVPAGTPPAVVATLNDAFHRVLEEPAVRQRILDIGAIAVGGSADEAVEGLREETARLGALIREAGITTE